MGEWSKKIGEHGESIIENFLKLIGWADSQKGLDIPSVNPEKHQKKSAKSPRSTHGIDFYFNYRSPLINSTLENVLISAKYSTKSYPSSPITTFKEHFIDLAWAIESFKKSSLRLEVNNSYKSIDDTFDRGVLFWINNDFERKDNIINAVDNCVMPNDLVHDGIFVVDNKKMGFIYQSIRFAKSNFPSSEIDFVYFNTGLNHDAITSQNSKILPVQYINSNILPIKIRQPNQITTFLITVLDSFDKDVLLRVMGLAKSIGTELQSETLICFNDYDPLANGNDVQLTKSRFEDKDFTNNLTVANYNTDFRL